MKIFRKSTLTIAVLTLAVLPVSAQQFGLKAGFNLAGISGDYFIELKSLSGFRFGGFYTFDLGGGLQIQPEAYFAQKGAGYSDSGVVWGIPFTIEGKLKIDYFEVPILAKYLFNAGTLKPFVYAGPYIAFKASAKGEVVTEVAEMGRETETEDLDDVKSTDFGAVFGAGVSLPLGGLDLILDVRYSLGLSNISTLLDESIKNGVFSIILGVGF